jgi:hypothetical protein
MSQATAHVNAADAAGALRELRGFVLASTACVISSVERLKAGPQPRGDSLRGRQTRKSCTVSV